MRKLGIVFFYLIVASCVADSATTPKSRPVTTVINEPQTAEILSPPSGSRPVKAKQITASQRPRKVRSERRSKAVVSASLSQKQSPGGNGNWVIQLASVRNETQARREWRRLLGRYPIILYGKEPMIVRANLRERGVFYRLKVGGFERKGTALIACTDIRASGGRCLALRRRGQNATRSNLCAHSTVNSFTRRTGGKNPPAQASVAKANALTTQKNSALSEVSKLKSALVVARGEAGQRETRLAKFAEIELARKAAVQELGKMQAANKAKGEELQKAKEAMLATTAYAERLRGGLQVAGEKILALEAELSNVDAPTCQVGSARTALQEAEAKIAVLTKAAEGAKDEAATAKSKLQAAVSKLDTLAADKNSALSELSKLKTNLVAARPEIERQKTEPAKFAEIELARKATVQERGKVRAAKNVHDKELRNAVKSAQALRAETKFLRKILAAENQQWNETEAALTSALKIELAAANEEIARLSAALGENRKR